MLTVPTRTEHHVVASVWIIGLMLLGSAQAGTPKADSDPNDLKKFGMFAKTAAVPQAAVPIETALPLQLKKGARVALIGNTLFEREQQYGYLETLIQQRSAGQGLVFRNLAWAADTFDLQPRPANFASIQQHLTHEKVDVIFAAFGFNESFAGEAGLSAFRAGLSTYLIEMKSKAYNGKQAPQIVLVSPIPSENLERVPAADLNNARIKIYVEAMRTVAAEQKIGFVDVFTPMLPSMNSAGNHLTGNGIHLEDAGYALFAKTLFSGLFNEPAPEPKADVRAAVVEKDKQYFWRYRPLNTFYYTGDRNVMYGYLDFLPAMRNFDVMVANRDQRIQDLAQGKTVAAKIDDSNVPPMPSPLMNRAVNTWKTPAEEKACFKMDPRFEVNLFASEQEFPELANPIQMRWDSRGRLWVSCSTTYPHVYPGHEPNDKIVILEDTDGDGKADSLTVFADKLYDPLAFEFGDGGVYVADLPNLLFLKDTNGDGKADLRKIVMSGFGTEDSHHAIHDFMWTPDGDLIMRESIFHHSQVETPYGPVRMQNSGWFRFQPRTQRLLSFGSYPSTNPWGVTFDDWGQHVASHPIYAEAFHATNPPYPQQFDGVGKLRAYSGTCGQEFVDTKAFPPELQGCFIKNRYKPTNRVEIHKWNEQPFGYDEEYVSDLLFSTDLNFIPVDLKFGPRGDMFICDWYNPVKGHAQYSLRDERRDHSSGRIWRITAKGLPLQEPPKIAGATIPELFEILKRPESAHRYRARRELRERDVSDVRSGLDAWLKTLDPKDARFRHHQLEGLWVSRAIDALKIDIMRDLLACDEHHARAAATQQLRYTFVAFPDAISLLQKAANDDNAIVRMEAAIAATYIGTQDALDAMLDILKRPRDGHLAYAFNCALQSEALRKIWEGKPKYAELGRILQAAKQPSEFAEPKATAAQDKFDKQKNVTTVRIECVPEQMRFAQTRVVVLAGQPVKLVFVNPDANDHNLVIVKPDAMDEVGMAANEMAKDPRNANSDFVPADKANLIVQATPMLGPGHKTKVHVLRFSAPKETGVYPYICTFPGHWIAMAGEMVVVNDLKDVDKVLATRKVREVVKEWTVADFKNDLGNLGERSLIRGMKAFAAAKCMLCHTVDHHGGMTGPDLTKVSEKYKGEKLLIQIVEPSLEINENFRAVQIKKTNGEVLVGTIEKETATDVYLRTSPLQPEKVTVVPKADISKRTFSTISAMPVGMLNVLTKEEILDLLAYLEAGGLQLPPGLKAKH